MDNIIESTSVSQPNFANIFFGGETPPRIGTFIVLKITQACNLRCSYCYSCGGETNQMMETALAVKAIEQTVFANPGKLIHVAFHGGEPLVAKQTIYEVVEIISAKPYRNRIRYVIQTNGTLLNQEIIEFIKKNKIMMGISLDGIKEANKLRVDVMGRESYERVLRGMEKLRENQVPFGISSVITTKNIDAVEDLMNLCAKFDVASLKLDVFMPFGYGQELDLAPTNLQFFELSKKILHWMIEHNSKENVIPLYEKNLQGIVHNVVNVGIRGGMCSSSPCGAGVEHFGLSQNGDVYICDTFYSSDQYIMGNLYESSLFQMWEKSTILSKFQTPHFERVEKCSKCDINLVCFGGCPSESIAVFGESAWQRESHLCQYYSLIIPYIQKLLSEGISPQLLGITDNAAAGCSSCSLG